MDPSDPVWVEHYRAYRAWVAASEGFLKVGMGLSEEGHDVEGLDEFRRAVEEARYQVELWDLEAELPPIEEARRFARPENPRPARYGAESADSGDRMDPLGPGRIFWASIPATAAMGKSAP